MIATSDAAETMLHQPLGTVIDALGEGGVLWLAAAFLLCLVVAYASRNLGKPAKRRASDPPLCSAYASHPPENCVEDPPESLAARLRRPYFALLWVIGLALAMTVGWRTHVVLSRSWTPVIAFDVGRYHEALRAQCPAAHGWLRDLSYQINQRGCIYLAGCVRMTAIAERCRMAPPVGSEDSERALVEAFATQRECQGVRLEPYVDASEVEEIRERSNVVYFFSMKPSWTDDDKRPWRLTRNRHTVYGTDAIRPLAAEACRAAKNWD